MKFCCEIFSQSPKPIRPISGQRTLGMIHAIDKSRLWLIEISYINLIKGAPRQRKRARGSHKFYGIFVGLNHPVVRGQALTKRADGQNGSGAYPLYGEFPMEEIQEEIQEVGPITSILCMAVIAGALWGMKKISDNAAAGRGEEPKSWSEWLWPKK